MASGEEEIAVSQVPLLEEEQTSSVCDFYDLDNPSGAETEEQTVDRKLYTGDGSVDYRGNRVIRSRTGTWKACYFILSTECCERLAYYGIATNLVTYLSDKLHISNVNAARDVTTWQGTCYLTPLIGAVLADSYWGRYWTIIVFSSVYLLGMCILTLSATLPGLKPVSCAGADCSPSTSAQLSVLFFGLYLIALGTGGIKPCVSSFGADQFDDTHADEQRRKTSFFNWFYFAINIGALISSTVIVWIQDRRGWGLGFGIPAFAMAVAIGSFFAGTPIYRFQKPGSSPFTRISQVLAASAWNWNVTVPDDPSRLNHLPSSGSSRKLEHSDGLRCLDRAAVLKSEPGGAWKLCTVTQVEEVKILVRFFPIWVTGIVFSAVYAQMSTLFVEQGMVMYLKIGSWSIPPASLSTFDVVSVMVWAPLYDRVIVPAIRWTTGHQAGLSVLRRMGVGLFLSVLCMVAAAVVEIRRLEAARLNPDFKISIFWQVPQYALLGAAEVFTFIGQLEFFYEQAPDHMRSLCSALSLLTTGLGNYLSSFILTVVTSITTRGGRTGWITDDLNRGHLDYYFWLLAALSLLNMFLYIACAKRYRQKTPSAR